MAHPNFIRRWNDLLSKRRLRASKGGRDKNVTPGLRDNGRGTNGKHGCRDPDRYIPFQQ